MAFIRTAVLALAMGAASVTAMPVQAGDHHSSFFYGDFELDCMTDYQIRKAIAAEGFTNIFLNVVDDDGDIQVKATANKTVYLIDYDTCDHEIEGIEPLYALR